MTELHSCIRKGSGGQGWGYYARKAESQWGTTEAWGWGTQGTEGATVMSLEGEEEQGVKEVRLHGSC